MEGCKPSFHSRTTCCTKQELQEALQAPAQQTVGGTMVRQIDRLQETMKEETSILLQMKTCPNIAGSYSENVATGADAVKSQQS